MTTPRLSATITETTSDQNCREDNENSMSEAAQQPKQELSEDTTASKLSLCSNASESPILEEPANEIAHVPKSMQDSPAVEIANLEIAVPDRTLSDSSEDDDNEENNDSNDEGSIAVRTRGRTSRGHISSQKSSRCVSSTNNTKLESMQPSVPVDKKSICNANRNHFSSTSKGISEHLTIPDLHSRHHEGEQLLRYSSKRSSGKKFTPKSNRSSRPTSTLQIGQENTISDDSQSPHHFRRRSQSSVPVAGGSPSGIDAPQQKNSHQYHKPIPRRQFSNRRKYHSICVLCNPNQPSTGITVSSGQDFKNNESNSRCLKKLDYNTVLKTYPPFRSSQHKIHVSGANNESLSRAPSQSYQTQDARNHISSHHTSSSTQLRDSYTHERQGWDTFVDKSASPSSENQVNHITKTMNASCPPDEVPPVIEEDDTTRNVTNDSARINFEETTRSETIQRLQPLSLMNQQADDSTEGTVGNDVSSRFSNDAFRVVEGQQSCNDEMKSLSLTSENRLFGNDNISHGMYS